jgi:hypothetical protein
MGFCTRCGANLGEMEDALRRGMAAQAGVQLVGPGVTQQGVGAPEATSSPPEGTEAAPAADEAPTTAFPRVRRPQAEVREQDKAISAMWHPDAEDTERFGPVQHGGARAPWLRRARPSQPILWFRPAALFGGALAVGAAFLPWIRSNFHATAFRFAARFLIGGQPKAGSLTVGIVLVVISGLGFVLSLLRPVSILRRFVGLLVLAVPVLFSAVGLLPASASVLFHELGPGAYTAAVGGLLLLVG